MDCRAWKFKKTLRDPLYPQRMCGCKECRRHITDKERDKAPVYSRSIKDR